MREATKPVDLKLHSDIRAEERAEFDNQVHAVKLFINFKFDQKDQTGNTKGCWQNFYSLNHFPIIHDLNYISVYEANVILT